MIRTLIRFFAWVLILIFPYQVEGGSLRAVPVHIFLDQKMKTAAIRVTNDGEEKTVLRVETFRWDQDTEGKDVYEPTEDLVFFPKMLSLEKGEEKIVRVGYSGKKAEPVERTYRIFLQELPVSKPAEGTINIALRMGLPVFIKPAKEIHEKKIEELTLSEEVLRVSVRNDGNSHEMVSKISVRGLSEGGEEVFLKEVGGWYVLAGRTHPYDIKIPRSDCLKANKIKLELRSNKTLLKGSLELNPDMCREKTKDSAGTEP